MQDNMSQEDVGKVEAFIQNEEPGAMAENR